MLKLKRIRRSSPQTFFDRIENIMSKKLSTTSFIISMLVILFIGGAFLTALHLFVNPKANPITSENYQPVTSKPVSVTLDLSSPDDDLLVFDNNLLVSGKTTPGALVLITLNDENQMIMASNNGDFSLTVKLGPTVNQLAVSSFDNSGNYKSESRTIYYSVEKL